MDYCNRPEGAGSPAILLIPTIRMGFPCDDGRDFADQRRTLKS